MDLSSLYERECGAGDVPSGDPFRPWRVRILTKAEFEDLGANAPLSYLQLAYLAAFNLLAPTSHNTVPQRFFIDPKNSRLSVVLDRSFVLSASDVHGRQAAVSVGCGIANSVIAAECYGLRAHVHVLDVPVESTRPMVPGATRYVTLADIVFTPSSVSSLPRAWLGALVARKMVRAEYDAGVSLSGEVVAKLDGWIRDRHDDIQLHLVTDTPTKLFVGKFQELADSTVVNRDSFAIELGDWLLQNDADAVLGMRGREFGLDDEATRRLRGGLRREISLLPDELAGFARAGNIGIRSSSAIGVLTVHEDTVPARLRAGWAFEELALLLYQHGFVTAMHAGITEVDVPNMALRGRLRTTRRPTVVFRMGKPLQVVDGLRPHSSRPPLTDLILTDAPPR